MISISFESTLLGMGRSRAFGWLGAGSTLLVLGLLGAPSPVYAACPYMPHNTMTVGVSIGPVTLDIQHGNYGVGYSGFYKRSGRGGRAHR